MQETFKFWDLVRLILEVLRYFCLHIGIDMLCWASWYRESIWKDMINQQFLYEYTWYYTFQSGVVWITAYTHDSPIIVVWGNSKIIRWANTGRNIYRSLRSFREKAGLRFFESSRSSRLFIIKFRICRGHSIVIVESMKYGCNTYVYVLMSSLSVYVFLTLPLPGKFTLIFYVASWNYLSNRQSTFSQESTLC